MSQASAWSPGRKYISVNSQKKKRRRKIYCRMNASLSLMHTLSYHVYCAGTTQFFLFDYRLLSLDNSHGFSSQDPLKEQIEGARFAVGGLKVCFVLFCFVFAFATLFCTFLLICCSRRCQRWNNAKIKNIFHHMQINKLIVYGEGINKMFPSFLMAFCKTQNKKKTKRAKKRRFIR